jgi:hypothetical protein
MPETLERYRDAARFSVEWMAFDLPLTARQGISPRGVPATAF